jgi:F-type H+-transporting ATPase subunit delta
VSEAQVARVYARALFDAARDAGGVERINGQLEQLGEALKGSAPLRSVLLNPQVEVSAKHRVIAALLTGADPLLVNAVQLIVEKGRESVLGDVCREYAGLAGEEARVVKVDVTSATALPAAARKRIADRVAAATGLSVELSVRTDADILGGLVLRFGDVIVDGSVRGRLQQLHARLATAQLRGDNE